MLGKEVDSVQDACALLANAKQQCLLILDNADDPNYDYQDYLPAGMQGAVIITSRVADCKDFSTAGWEPLTSLSEEDSRELLLRAARIPSNLWHLHGKTVDDIVSLLGSHTLALIQAGAYIARGHCDLRQYSKDFERQRKLLLEFRPKQAKSRYSDVYTTFEASAAVLSQDGQQLLKIISMLHFGFLSLRVFAKAWSGSNKAIRRPIKGETSADRDSNSANSIELTSASSSNLSRFHAPEGTIQSSSIPQLNGWHSLQLPEFMGAKEDQWDTYRLKEAIYLLESLSLITSAEEDGERGISMHPLAHAWSRDRQNLEARKHTWIMAACFFTLAFEASESTSDYVDRNIQPHIQRLLDEKCESKITCGLQGNLLALLKCCADMAFQMQDDLRLERLLNEELGGAGFDPFGLQTNLIPLYFYLAWIQCRNGRLKDGISLMEHIVQIEKTTLADTDPRRLISQYNLAWCYEKNGQTVEAINVLEKILQIQKRVLPETHEDVLYSQHSLGCHYNKIGRIQEAIKIFEQNVKIQRQTMSETHKDILVAQHELAFCYRKNSQFEEAIDLFEKVVTIQKKILPETHPGRLESEQELGNSYRKNGEIQKALELLEPVVRIQRLTLPEMSWDRLRAELLLRECYRVNGQSKECRELSEHIEDMLTKISLLEK
jgi:tetratricopeptide (TPR) repeat protein